MGSVQGGKSRMRAGSNARILGHATSLMLGSFSGGPVKVLRLVYTPTALPSMLTTNAVMKPTTEPSHHPIQRART